MDVVHHDHSKWLTLQISRFHGNTINTASCEYNEEAEDDIRPAVSGTHSFCLCPWPGHPPPSLQLSLCHKSHTSSYRRTGGKGLRESCGTEDRSVT